MIPDPLGRRRVALGVGEREHEQADALGDDDPGGGRVGVGVVAQALDAAPAVLGHADVGLALKREVVRPAPVGLVSVGVVDRRRPGERRPDVEQHGGRVAGRPAALVGRRGLLVVGSGPRPERLRHVHERLRPHAVADPVEFDPDLRRMSRRLPPSPGCESHRQHQAQGRRLHHSNHVVSRRRRR